MYSIFDIVDNFTPPEFFIIKLFFPLYSVFDTVEQYAPGFKESVVGRDILTPPDLERVFSLTGGVFVTWYYWLWPNYGCLMNTYILKP